METFLKIREFRDKLADPSSAKIYEFKCSEIQKSYDINWKNPIGEGVSGKVYKCKSKFDEQEYALKIIPDNRSSRREISLQQNCSDSQNVVKIVDVFRGYGIHPTAKYGNKYLYVVLEMMKGGELFDIISKFGSIPENTAASYIKQITLALMDLHKRGLIHRDIKPENILLKAPISDLSKEPELKLADFGFACEESSNPVKPDYTPYYAPPEILCKDKRWNQSISEADRLPYDHRCDIWSLGVVTYILISGYPPFYPEANYLDMSHYMYDSIIHGKFRFHSQKWRYISSDAQDFISSLLKVDPNDRLSLEQILQHPWLVKNEKPVLELMEI